MDAHGIAEARSLAYHRAIAERFAADPGIVDRARARVRDWQAAHPDAHFVRGWSRILERPVREIAAFLVDDSEEARELRQSTPFAGVLGPRERWRLCREVGERARAGE